MKLIKLTVQLFIEKDGKTVIHTAKRFYRTSTESSDATVPENLDSLSLNGVPVEENNRLVQGECRRAETVRFLVAEFFKRAKMLGVLDGVYESMSSLALFVYVLSFLTLFGRHRGCGVLHCP